MKAAAVVFGLIAIVAAVLFAVLILLPDYINHEDPYND